VTGVRLSARVAKHKQRIRRCSGGRIVSWIIYCWLVWCERKTLFLTENLRSFTSTRTGWPARVCECVTSVRSFRPRFCGPESIIARPGVTRTASSSRCCERRADRITQACCSPGGGGCCLLRACVVRRGHRELAGPPCPVPHRGRGDW